MANQNPTRVVTGRVRLSFVHLFTPYKNPNATEPKYSATILLPKSDVATKQRIDAAISAAIEMGVSKTWNGVRPPMIAIPVYDGDGVRPSDGMPFGDECKGHWVFTASSKQAPQIVDAQLNPIIDQTQVYSGMYAHVSMNFFPYLNSGKRGIGCGLGNVQKVADGEPLGGRTNAQDDFAPVQQPGYGQQAPGYRPPQPNYGQAYPPQQQPAYGQPVPGQQPPYQQPVYGQPVPGQQPPVQIDPITGKPVNGGVMGIS